MFHDSDLGLQLLPLSVSPWARLAFFISHKTARTAATRHTRDMQVTKARTPTTTVMPVLFWFTDDSSTGPVIKIIIVLRRGLC